MSTDLVHDRKLTSHRNARPHSGLVMGLCFVAAAFLAFEAVAALQWLREAGSVARAGEHFLRALRSDWMLIIVVADHLLIAFAVLMLGWRDAISNGITLRSRLGWTLLFVALGSP